MKQDLTDWLNGLNTPSQTQGTPPEEDSGLLLAPLGASPLGTARPDAAAPASPQPETPLLRAQALLTPESVSSIDDEASEVVELVETLRNIQAGQGRNEQDVPDQSIPSPLPTAPEPAPRYTFPEEDASLQSILQELAAVSEGHAQSYTPYEEAEEGEIEAVSLDPWMPERPDDDQDEPQNRSQGRKEQDDYSMERDVLFAQKLHRVIQMKRDRAAERQDQRQKKAGARRWPWVLVLSLLLLLAFAAGYIVLRHVRGDSRERLNDEASDLYRQGRYEEAMEVYQRAYEKYPDSLSFLIGFARSAGKTDHLQRAVMAWELYLRALPEAETAHRAQALYDLANVHSAMGAPTEAILCLDQSLKLDPTNYDASLSLGGLLERQGDAQGALQAYEAALRLRPSSTEAAEAGRRLREALSSARPSDKDRAAQTHPLFETQIGAGVIALNMKLYDEAIASFTQALEITSGDARAWLGLAGAYRGKGARTEALRVAEEANRACPDHPTIETLLYELQQGQQ